MKDFIIKIYFVIAILFGFLFNNYFKKKKVNKSKKFLLIILTYIILTIIMCILYGDIRIQSILFICLIYGVILFTLPVFCITYNKEPNNIDTVKEDIESEEKLDNNIVEGKDKSIIFLKGRNGTVSVEKNVVIIRREGAMGFLASGVMGQGDKRIPIKNIVSVELGKEPSFMGGISYIRFATAADNEVRKHSSLVDPSLRMFENKGGQYFNDPNTIQLSNMEQYAVAIRIRDYIENFQVESANPTVVQSLSGADEILKYKKLLDEGILTQEEFDAKKRQLLEL